MSLSNRATIESGLLCAALCGPEFVAEIQSRTQPRPIRDPDRAAYWQILQRRAENGEPFDLDTIIDECEQKKLNLQVLMGLQAARFECGHIPYYCDQLQRLNEIDDVRSLGAQLQRDTEPDVDEYIARLDEIRQTELATLCTQEKALEAMDARHANPAAVHKTGLEDRDAALGGGLKAGQLVVVGGRACLRVFLMLGPLVGCFQCCSSSLSFSFSLSPCLSLVFKPGVECVCVCACVC